VAAGRLLALLPHRWVEGVVGALFMAGAAMLLFQREEEDDPHVTKEPSSTDFLRVAASGFLLVLIAELGDLTQITTANLAARYSDPLAVALGSWLALCSVSALAILGGQKLLKYVPLRIITRVAALVMLTMAGFSIAGAVTG
jgi:Ca2+/H+ antiporter, TMEM165/GDT1 family